MNATSGPQIRPRDAVRHRPAARAVDSGAASLAATLWTERELLEQLLFALTGQQLILAAGELRWLTKADEQVRSAVAGLRDCELRRAIFSAEFATELELPADATLSSLAQAAPTPWDLVLTEHRDALRSLSGEISALSIANRRLLHAGADATREALAHVGSTVADHADAVARGFHGGVGAAGPILIDQQA